MSEPIPDDDEDDRPHRLLLLWRLLVFQGKLVVDGLRDVILSPVAIIAVVAGIIGGGDRPDRYFREVLRMGRRSEVWINLFGYRKGATSDKLVEPLEQRLLAEYQRGGWLSKAERHMQGRPPPPDGDRAGQGHDEGPKRD